MSKLKRVSSGYRIRSPERYFTVSKLSDDESSPFLLLQMIQIFLLMSRLGFCFYKMWYRLKLQRAAFDEDVQIVVQTMVTKQSDLFVWIQVVVLLSYIVTATVFVYYIVQETHLPIPMVILCAEFCFQFSSSILACFVIIMEMIGVGTVFYLTQRKKIIRKKWSLIFLIFFK